MRVLFYIGGGQHVLKDGQFLPSSRASDVPHVAKIFFKEIVCLHGLLQIIVLGRDTEFMSYF